MGTPFYRNRNNVYQKMFLYYSRNFEKCFRNQYHYNDIIDYGITFMNTNQSYTNTYYDNNYCTDG